MAGGHLTKYFVWRFDVWGGGYHWMVCTHPPGGERKVAWPDAFKSPDAAAKQAQAMNHDWQRYERAMQEKAQSRG